MALISYELSSWHPDPEGHLEPIDWSHSEDVEPSQIWIRTQHSANMPECVARSLHEYQVRGVLDDYELGAKPEENYEIHRVDDNYEVPF